MIGGKHTDNVAAFISQHDRFRDLVGRKVRSMSRCHGGGSVFVLDQFVFHVLVIKVIKKIPEQTQVKACT